MALRFNRLFHDALELLGRDFSFRRQLALHIAVELEFGGRLQGFLPLADVSAGLEKLGDGLAAFRPLHQLQQDQPVGAERDFLQHNVGQ